MEAATAPPTGNGTEPEEPMEGEATEEQGLPPVELEGTGQLSLKIGGKKPDVGTMKLRGGSIGIPAGQYDRGDAIDCLVKIRCDSVAFIDKHDNTTGQITEVERRHTFTVQHIERIGA